MRRLHELLAALSITILMIPTLAPAREDAAAARPDEGGSPVHVRPQIVSSNLNGIRLRLEAPDPGLRSLTIDGVVYAVLDLPGAANSGNPGTPELPRVRAVLGVPECDAVNLTVTVDGTRRLEGVRIVPAPELVAGEDGELSESVRRESDVYRDVQVWPPRAATLTGPRWLGPQRTVTIEFTPCRYDAERGALVVHRTIDAVLTFEGVRSLPGDEPVRVRPRHERLLDATLLNAESARPWRRSGPLVDRSRPDDYYSSSENWARLRITERGMHRVGYDDLSGAGVSVASIDPASLRVFSGGGLVLPTGLDDPRPDWMTECAILVEGEGDGSFDPGDGVVFFALAEDGWADEYGLEGSEEPYYESPYANENVYWLTWESVGTPSGFSAAPLRMIADDEQDAQDPTVLDAYYGRHHFERNIVVKQGRGDNWFWHDMSATEDWRYFHQEIDGVVTDSLGALRGRVHGNSSTASVYPDHHVRFLLNDTEAYDAEWDAYMPLSFEGGGLPMNDGYNTIAVNIPRDIPGVDDEAILIDWFEILCWRSLTTTDDRIAFGSSGKTGVLEFRLDGFNSAEARAFKIVDQYTVRTVPGLTTRGAAGEDGGGRAVSLSFQDDVADTASYEVVADGAYRTPEIELDSFVDLRTPTDDDYILIAHDELYDQSLRLKQHRESEAGGSYSVRLVRLSDVYDEFSWGLVDPTAIRDYLKHTWESAASPPTHALLVGDGTVDPRQYSASSLRTYIPVHYTVLGPDTHDPTYWPTEPWFAGFDAESEYIPGVAIGRLTVNSVSELTTMVDKIIEYDADSEPALWKNRVILLADDEYTYSSSTEQFHTEQTEMIASEILPHALDRDKVYLMEYEKVGAFKPAARAALLEAWNEGGTLMNYTGHGSEIVMAHESAFYFDDVTLLSNRPGLPLFIAASCRLNKFDRMTVDSLGEALAKSATGGSIASIGSTRDSWASQNSLYNRHILRAIFGDQQDDPAAQLDVGAAMQAGFAAAAGYTEWVNDTRFMLVGDPALVLATPKGSGTLTSEDIDPMRRRDEVTIEGACSGATSGLDGIAMVRVTESADTSGYTLPANGYHVFYALPGETVFDGPVTVNDGEFDATFFVSYAAREGDYAKVRAYCYDDETDGAMALVQVALADSVESTDATGPDVSIEFAGGATSVAPGAELVIALTDESGINTVTGSPGAPLSLVIDGTDTTDVTGSFRYDLGSFDSGVVDYDLPTLEYGLHSIELSASDNMGNRSTGQLGFEVVSAADFEIRNVASHPNPFPAGGESGTWILFQLPVPANVRIDIFTVGGRRVRTLDDIPAGAGANQIYWDGFDVVGDELANGVYLYRIMAVSEGYRGDKAEAIGRAVIMR